MSRVVADEAVIKGHGGEIGIVVFGYENRAAENASDANWLTCHVRVVLGAWRGEVNAAFTTGDFMAFRSQLRELLNGERQDAAFQTDMGSLEFRIEMARTGTCRIRGSVEDARGPEVKLAFDLESDQSFLRPALSSLDTITEHFPVRA